FDGGERAGDGDDHRPDRGGFARDGLEVADTDAMAVQVGADAATRVVVADGGDQFGAESQPGGGHGPVQPLAADLLGETSTRARPLPWQVIGAVDVVDDGVAEDDHLPPGGRRGGQSAVESACARTASAVTGVDVQQRSQFGESAVLRAGTQVAGGQFGGLGGGAREFVQPRPVLGQVDAPLTQVGGIQPVQGDLAGAVLAPPAERQR